MIIIITSYDTYMIYIMMIIIMMAFELRLAMFQEYDEA